MMIQKERTRHALYYLTLLAVVADIISGFAELYFKVEPSDIIVVKDAPAMLDCVAIGNPVPVIEWKKEGAIMQFIGETRRSILPNGSLYFSSVYHTRTERPDEGVYQCIATIKNVGTIVSRLAKLQIASLPRFDEQPRDMTVFPGQSAYFPCAIQSIPPAIIYWLKDEQLFQLDHSRMIVLPSGALEIDHIQATDSGTYRCNASNIEKFRLSSAGTLSVSLDYAEANRISAPQFIATPKDIIAVEGNNVTLDCAANGNPRTRIVWLKDGITIDMAHLDSKFMIVGIGNLQIENVKESDKGTYMCRAENHEDSVDASATLEVQVPPYFGKKPQNKYAYEKEDLEFECEIHGFPEPSVQWVKDGDLIIQSEYFQLINGYNLRILGLVRSDMGIYQCIGSNPSGNTQSSAQLVILDPAEANRISAPQFIATPKDIIAVEGNNVTLDCAANGNPRTRIVWLKDGITIDMAHLDSKFMIVGIGNLQIENVKESDKGTYMCRAENHEDSVDASATLEVQVPPYFGKKPQNKYAYEKEDLEFECEIHGFPEPSVQWVKDGDLIIQSEYFQLINGYNLRILGLVRSDMGIYQCIGSNPSGNTQSSAQLVILDPDPSVPTFYNSVTTPQNISGAQPHSKDVPSSPRDVVAVIVSTRFVTLSWKEPLHTNGEIVAYSVYYREDQSTRERVVNTTRPRLEEVSIQGLQPSTKFYFRIVAYNLNGPGQSSEEVMVETQPEVHVPGSPESLQATAISPNAIQVQWKAPDQKNGPIQKYKLYYMEVGTSEEHEITTSDTKYTLYGLKKYTDYNFWIVAYNQNGPGMNTEEVTARTFSDFPSDTPQNVTLEAASSTSIIVRWEPPAKDNQNGIITGYKIRYKLKGSRRGDTVTTDGNRRLYAITGLERGAQYSVKISALSINGSGPATDWMTVDTYQNDLDEGRVPDQPSSVRARPTANTIFVSWTPPRNQNIMIRGYTIGWGIGFPDVYTKVLDGKQRYYTIENLQPSAEYVISLRAFNQVGDGRPIYETVKTLIESTPEPIIPMLPPVGLKAIVLSSTTVVLYWTDSTLPRNQVINDNRYYTVRYTGSTYSSNPKYRYFNSTDLNCMIDDLKPNSQYEFSVKVVKGRRESTWSMSVLNSTHEAAPSSPPRDIKLVEADSALTIQWQPPKQPNGEIIGYVIFYTTDNTQHDRDWIIKNINSNHLSAAVDSLTSDTTYYFKIQARNNKGYGPFSSEVSYHTKKDNDGFTSNMLYIIVASVGGFILVIAIITSIVFCKRRRNRLRSIQKVRYGTNKGGNKGKGIGKELKPPDLWIHHDQMELKSMQKGNQVESTLTITPIPRNSQELADEMINMLDKKAGTYVAISSTATIPNSTMGQHFEGSAGLSRPLYPRTQYNIPRAHVSVDTSHPDSPDLPSPSHNQQPPLPYEQAISQSTPAPHITLCPTMVMGTGQHPSYSTVPSSGSGMGTLGRNEASASGTLGKRSQAHPLKSFSVPAPPCQSAPTTPQQKHIVRSQPLASPHKGFNTPTCSTPAGPSSQQSTLKSHSTMPIASQY
ncbi:neogenin-like isoform X2 [Centruroides sculpturatus]|uniref:neogenin-like isoform X2 n=1 Tax=Centruroides sculpturatus TaxID=218467 RepID=UPI000C6DECA3|nr:neogenin-like isoform X2 [Centruroides sculpturatus]